jgi:hypothetical protein
MLIILLALEKEAGINISMHPVNHAMRHVLLKKLLMLCFVVGHAYGSSLDKSRVDLILFLRKERAIALHAG